MSSTLWSAVRSSSSHGARSVTLEVVLSEEVPELRRQRQLVDALIRGAATHHRPAQVLQGEGEVPGQGPGEQGLKEEAGGGVTVVFEQPRHAGVPVHAGVASIEAETLVALLDARMQRAAVAAEADGEEEFVLGGVPEQEGALRLALQQLLGLEAVQHPPVAGAVVDLQEVRHQNVVRVAARCPVGAGRVPVLQATASCSWRAADVLPGEGRRRRGAGGGGRGMAFMGSLQALEGTGMGSVFLNKVPAVSQLRLGGEGALVLHEL